MDEVLQILLVLAISFATGAVVAYFSVWLPIKRRR